MNRYHQPPGIVGTYIFPGFLISSLVMIIVACLALRFFESEQPKPILPPDSIPITVGIPSCASAQCNLTHTYHTTRSLLDLMAFYQEQGTSCTQQVEGHYSCLPLFSEGNFTTPAATQSVRLYPAEHPSSSTAQQTIVLFISWRPWEPGQE
jgi:hypothetical protein